MRVSGADWERLGVEAGRVAHFVGNRAYMRMRDGHCAALELRTAADGAREFFCTIYERRPQVCRDLARGSPECAGELATKSARVADASGAAGTDVIDVANHTALAQPACGIQPPVELAG